MSETLANMERLGEIDYSTDEQWTGQRWIDGKKIYQKTISCGVGANKTEKTVAHGINNLGNVIKIEGIGKAGNNNYINIPSVTDRIFSDSSTASGYMMYQLVVQVSTSNIVLMARDSDCSSITNIHVTLQYTKTTT